MTAAVRLPMLPSAADLLRATALSSDKRLAQHFLLDMNTCRKLAKYVAGPQARFRLRGHAVCEVGAGPGSLTRALLERQPDRLTAIEIDRRFFPMLQVLREPAGGRLSIEHADALHFDYASRAWAPTADDARVYAVDWLDERLPRTRLAGNLPFNVATPLVVRLLRWMSERSGPFQVGRTPCALLVQKEVGWRMCAPIAGAHRCRLSVICQYLANVRLACATFVPRPLVDGALVILTPHRLPRIYQHFELVEKLFRHVFHYRRKWLRRGLADLYPEDVKKEMADEVLKRCRVSPTNQCTQLSLTELSDMCDVYYEQCLRLPGLYAFDFRYNKRPLDELAGEPNALPPKCLYERPSAADEIESRYADPAEYR